MFICWNWYICTDSYAVIMLQLTIHFINVTFRIYMSYLFWKSRYCITVSWRSRVPYTVSWCMHKWSIMIINKLHSLHMDILYVDVLPSISFYVLFFIDLSTVTHWWLLHLKRIIISFSIVSSIVKTPYKYTL